MSGEYQRLKYIVKELISILNSTHKSWVKLQF